MVESDVSSTVAMIIGAKGMNGVMVLVDEQLILHK